MRYLPYYGNKKLTLMFDYCSSCLWDGPMIDYEDIRLNKRTEHFIKKLKRKWEHLFDDVDFKYTDNYKFHKVMYRNLKLKKYTKEQYKIARMIKKQYPRKKISVFDELKYYKNPKEAKVEI